MSKAVNGDKVSVHYVGSFTDGVVFDSSKARGQTLEFELGGDGMISGFNDAVIGMSVGETKKVVLEPEQAYGDVNEHAVLKVTRNNFPEDFDVSPGSRVSTTAPNGQTAFGVIKEVEGEDVVVDMNHPLAGRSLTFEIELVSHTSKVTTNEEDNGTDTNIETN